MKKTNVTITVYGAEQLCASCVGAPGSKDTFEWLQAAIGRKYDAKNIYYEYIDIDYVGKGNHPEYEKMIKQIKADELFYPLITLNGEIIAEGIPHVKTIFKALEAKGIQHLS